MCARGAGGCGSWPATTTARCKPSGYRSRRQARLRFVAGGHGWLWEPTINPIGSKSLITCRLYATIDGGASWHALPADPYVDGITQVGDNLTALELASDQDGWALVMLPGQAGSWLLRTTDGGVRWSPAGHG